MRQQRTHYASLGLLALYQHEQETLFQQIKELLPDDRFPTYDEMPLFTYSLAVFYEALRMFLTVCVSFNMYLY